MQGGRRIDCERAGRVWLHARPTLDSRRPLRAPEGVGVVTSRLALASGRLYWLATLIKSSRCEESERAS